jgi:hypothetical protein
MMFTFTLKGFRKNIAKARFHFEMQKYSINLISKPTKKINKSLQKPYSKIQFVIFWYNHHVSVCVVKF